MNAAIDCLRKFFGTKLKLNGTKQFYKLHVIGVSFPYAFPLTGQSILQTEGTAMSPGPKRNTCTIKK